MSRSTHARLRRTLCLTLRNARVTSCFYNNMRNTNTKHPCKLQSGCMIFSTTHTRMLANFFANAFAYGIGKRALLATHHSIPVVKFFANLPSLAASFTWVICFISLLAARGRMWAGFFASASGERALSATPYPTPVAQLSAFLPSLVGCFKYGSCWSTLPLGGPCARSHAAVAVARAPAAVAAAGAAVVVAHAEAAAAAAALELARAARRLTPEPPDPPPAPPRRRRPNARQQHRPSPRPSACPPSLSTAGYKTSVPSVNPRDHAKVRPEKSSTRPTEQ